MINKNHEPELPDEKDAKRQAIKRAEVEVERVKEWMAKERTGAGPEKSSATSKLRGDAEAIKSELAHDAIRSTLLHLMASIVGLLGTTLASALALVGLHKSFSEIRPEYAPFVASILSAVVGLAMIFILARTFYKKRVQSSGHLAKRVRLQEARLFELVAQDFDALVGSHGRR